MARLLHALLLLLTCLHGCDSLSWFSSSDSSSSSSSSSTATGASGSVAKAGLSYGDQLIQCSSEAIKSYNTVPPVSGAEYGDLNWCRTTMKRAKTIM